MGFIKDFIKRKRGDVGWRDLNSLPKEVLSKKELDTLQKEVIDELEALQRDTINRMGSDSKEKPQTLFYYHKYIDSKFNKNDFDIETFYSQKQNIVDKKYADGLGDIKAEFTGYKEVLAEIREVERRMYRKVDKLDPNFRQEIREDNTYDDSSTILAQIEELSNEIDWHALEEAQK